MGEKTVLVHVAQLWRRLVDAPGVRVERPGEYGPRRGARVTDEEIAWLVLSGGADAGAVGPIDVVLADFSAHHGSSLDRANARVLCRDYGVSTRVGSRLDDHWQVVLPLGQFPSDTDADPTGEVVEDRVDWLRALVEAMERLVDYPLLDDETHSELEAELADEAWSTWLWADLSAELSRHLADRAAADGESTVDVDDYEAQIREAYYGYEDNEWTCESAFGAVNLRHGDAVAHILAQWDALARPA